MKKRTIIILCSFITVSVILGIIIYLQNIYGVKEKYISPNKEYIVVIKGYGPKWSFGSENIKVIAYKNSISGYFNKVKYDSEIKNDGKLLNDSNYEIKWDENIAYLSLIGEEQEDENLVIEFGDKINISKADNNKEIKENTDSFKAKVLKNEGNHDLLVKVIENSNFFKKGDEVKVKIENYQYLSIYYAEDLAVEIDFDGNIEESYPPQITSSSIGVLDYSTISIVANNKTISSKGATFSLKNYTDKEYIYGPDYYIETYENGNWKELSTLNGEPLTWNSIAYTLKANEEKEIKVDWTYAYGELKQGQYRLVKKVFKEEDRPITDDKILKLSSEFEIK